MKGGPVNRSFGYALCAGLTCFLAVVYTLLQIDWEPPPGAPVDAQGPAVPGQR
jgi:hypothetical protein